MSDLNITDHPAGATLKIRVKPRSSRSAIVGASDGVLVVALAAPPVDGEANAELLRLLATVFDLPKSHLQLLQGEKARLKTVRFSGVTSAQLSAQASALKLKPKS